MSKKNNKNIMRNRHENDLRSAFGLWAQHVCMGFPWGAWLTSCCHYGLILSADEKALKDKIAKKQAKAQAKVAAGAFGPEEDADSVWPSTIHRYPERS